MTNDMKVLLSLDVSQLKGVEVEALKHSHIEGDFLRGDKLTVYDRWGTMLYAYTEEGFNVLIRVRHARLLSDIELPTYCIFCNTTTENVHSADCPVIDELLKNYFSNNT